MLEERVNSGRTRMSDEVCGCSRQAPEKASKFHFALGWTRPLRLESRLNAATSSSQPAPTPPEERRRGKFEMESHRQPFWDVPSRFLQGFRLSLTLLGTLWTLLENATAAKQSKGTDVDVTATMSIGWFEGGCQLFSASQGLRLVDWAISLVRSPSDRRRCACSSELF